MESATGLLALLIVGLLVVFDDISVFWGLELSCSFLLSFNCWMLVFGRDLIGCDCCSEGLVLSCVGARGGAMMV